MVNYHRVGSAAPSDTTLDQSSSPLAPENPRWHEQSPLANSASGWNDQHPPDSQGFGPPYKKAKSRWPIWFFLAALVVIAAAVVIPVYFFVIKPKNHHASSSSSTSGSNGNNTSSGGTPPKTQTVLTGGDGSKITTEDGETFVYNNTFGGFCASISPFS